jgi:hypothetical protein
LLELTLGSESDHVGVGIPCALRSVGADEMVHDASTVCPLRKGAPTSEFDVVGMGADRQRRAGHCEVVGELSAL